MCGKISQFSGKQDRTDVGEREREKWMMMIPLSALVLFLRPRQSFTYSHTTLLSRKQFLFGETNYEGRKKLCTRYVFSTPNEQMLMLR